MMAEALKVVTPTLREVAVWCRVSYPTIRAYRTGDRRPTPATVTRFAAALRRHARLLGKLADRLEREAKGGAR
jgi:hypothetical protein